MGHWPNFSKSSRLDRASPFHSSPPKNRTKAIKIITQQKQGQKVSLERLERRMVVKE
jgi:hypothetical protein